MALSHRNLYKITLNVHVENEHIKLTKLEEKQSKLGALKPNFFTILLQRRIPKKAEASVEETGSPEHLAQFHCLRVSY